MRYSLKIKFIGVVSTVYLENHSIKTFIFVHIFSITYLEFQGGK